jgi:hypothetical protein
MNPARGVVDSIIHSSVVELFHSMAVAVAPVARTLLGSQLRPKASDLMGVIRFNGKGFAGQLMLVIPVEVIALIRVEPDLPAKQRDWTRELTNQLMGRVKNRLMHFQIQPQIGLPTVWEREGLQRHGRFNDSAIGYLFRTLRGELLVILDATIDESVFVYSGTEKIGSEGDVILF